jgi:hypothetical protein
MVITVAACILHRGGQAGLDDLNVHDGPRKRLIEGLRIGQEVRQRKTDRADIQLEAAVSHRPDGRFVLLLIDGFEADNIAGPEQHHAVCQIGQALLRS